MTTTPSVDALAATESIAAGRGPLAAGVAPSTAGFLTIDSVFAHVSDTVSFVPDAHMYRKDFAENVHPMAINPDNEPGAKVARTAGARTPREAAKASSSSDPCGSQDATGVPGRGVVPVTPDTSYQEEGWYLRWLARKEKRERELKEAEDRQSGNLHGRAARVAREIDEFELARLKVAYQ